MHKRKTRFRCEARAARGDRFRIAINGDKSPLWSESLENAGAVATTAEAGVEVVAGRAHGKSCKHLIDKHRFVLIQTPRPGASGVALYCNLQRQRIEIGR